MVENNSDIPICFIFISPSDSNDWGEDWLGDDEIIQPGESITFWVLPNQAVDMRVLDCDGDLMNEQYGIQITKEGITYTLSP